jgi:hypothetical protein
MELINRSISHYCTNAKMGCISMLYVGVEDKVPRTGKDVHRCFGVRVSGIRFLLQKAELKPSG